MQPLERPAVVVFDLDGTLEDSRLDMVQSINRVRASFGLEPVGIEAGFTMVNKGMDHLYRTAFSDILSDNRSLISEIEKRYLIDYAENIAVETKLYSGIEATLTRLAEHFPLILYTNKPEKHSKLLLKALEIHLFDEIMGGDSIDVSKPSQKPVEVALSRIAEKRGIDSKSFSIAMVGDTQGDMEIARNLKKESKRPDNKVHGIWVRWGYSEKVPDSPAPDYICDRPDELIQLLA